MTRAGCVLWGPLWVLLGAQAALAATEDWFEDRAADLGVDFVHFNGMSGRFYNVEVFGSGGALFDSDGDGDLDLYLVQGAMLGADRDYDDAIFPFSGERPARDRLFRNDLDGLVLGFSDATEASGIAATEYGLGARAGDLDNDGDTDVVVTNNSGPVRMLINTIGSANNWLGIRLTLSPKSVSSRRDALGATAVLRTGEKALLRRYHADGGYAASHDPRIFFGLGGGDGPPSTVEVRWPDGQLELFRDLDAGRHHDLGQGSGEPVLSKGDAEHLGTAADRSSRTVSEIFYEFPKKNDSREGTRGMTASERVTTLLRHPPRRDTFPLRSSAVIPTPASQEAGGRLRFGRSGETISLVAETCCGFEPAESVRSAG